MMKVKKIAALLLTTAILAGLCACSGKEAASAGEEGSSAETEQNETVGTVTEDKDTQGQEMNTGSGSKDNNAVSQESGPMSIKVFCINEDATQMKEETVEIESLSPENVLNALIQKEVVPADTAILSLKESEKDGEKVMDVDFNQVFGDYMNGKGTADEYLIMGGICNTFLNAYGCDKIYIMVEGEVLTTGHKEYTGYQNFYE